MLIQENSQVSFHFSIKRLDGTLVDNTRQRGKPAKLVVGDGQLLPSFEQCLMGLKEGDTKSEILAAEHAFGVKNPDQIQHLDKHRFQDQSLEVGTVMGFSGPKGSEIPGVITAISGESVTVDFNHPLAGEDVCFEVEILSVQ